MLINIFFEKKIQHFVIFSDIGTTQSPWSGGTTTSEPPWGPQQRDGALQATARPLADQP
jgi:hypothetical protein